MTLGSRVVEKKKIPMVRMHSTGFRLESGGLRVQGSHAHPLQPTRIPVLGVEHFGVEKNQRRRIGQRVSCLGFWVRVEVLGCRVWGAGFEVQGLGCRVQGLGLRLGSERGLVSHKHLPQPFRIPVFGV